MPKLVKKDTLYPSQCAIKCNICGKILQRKATLYEHIRDVHTDIKKITCTIGNCNYKTNRIGNYNLHLKKVHGLHLPIIPCTGFGCKKKSRNENSIINHMRKCKHKPFIQDTVKCCETGCTEEFLSDNGLKTHLIITHGLSIEEDKPCVMEIEDKSYTLVGEEMSPLEIFYKEVEELIYI